MLAGGKIMCRVGRASALGVALFALTFIPAQYAAAQDVPDDGTTTARLAVPGTITDTIEPQADRDIFLVALVSGGTYQFDAERTSDNLDTTLGLFSPGHVDFGSLDCNDFNIGSLARNDDREGLTTDSRITHTATQTGDHFLCVDALGTTSSSGFYRLTATVTTPPPPPTQDVPGDGSTTVRLAVPGTLTGTIGAPDDQDAFLVALVSGGTYQFDAEITSGGLDTTLGLYPPGHTNFVGSTSCHNATGVLTGNDDIESSGGNPSDSRITWTAAQTGDHVLCVDAFAHAGSGGGYTLTATVTTPPPGSPPDLSIAQPTGQNTGTLSFTVTNSGGPVAVDASTLGVYRTEQTLTAVQANTAAAAAPLCSVTESTPSQPCAAVVGVSIASEIAFDSPYSGTAATNTPVDAGTTDYYYFVCVTVATGSVRTCSPSGARVEITDLRFSATPAPAANPTTVPDGATFRISSAVENGGNVQLSGRATFIVYEAPTTLATPSPLTAASLDAANAVDVTPDFAQPPIGRVGTTGQSLQMVDVAPTLQAADTTLNYFLCIEILDSDINVENNCTGPLAVLVQGPPTIPDVSIATSSFDGDTLTATAANTGALATGASVEYYRVSGATDPRPAVAAAPPSGTPVCTATTVPVCRLNATAMTMDIPSKAASLAVPDFSITPPTATGNYYYFVCVAHADDTNKANDCGPSAGNPDPVLSISRPSGQNTATLEFSVTNGGVFIVGATTFSVYRAEQTLDASQANTAAATAPLCSVTESTNSQPCAVVTGVNTVTQLTPGAYSFTAATNTPIDAATTDYAYFACVTITSGGARTCSVTSPSVEITDLRILATPAPAATPTTVPDGGSFTFTASVENAGTLQPSRRSFFVVYEAPTTLATPSPLTVASLIAANAVDISPTPAAGTIARLGAGSSAPRTLAGVTPTAQATATTLNYFFCIESLPSDVNLENNCTGPIAVLVEGSPMIPDVSATATLSGTTLTALVSNTGVDAVGASVEYYRSLTARAAAAASPGTVPPLCSAASQPDGSGGGDNANLCRLTATAASEDIPRGDSDRAVTPAVTITTPTAPNDYYYFVCVTHADDINNDNDCGPSQRLNVDDFTEGVSRAGAVTLDGSTSSGIIGANNDRDWFTIPTQVLDTTYRFTITRAAGAGNALVPRLRVRAASGTVRQNSGTTNSATRSQRLYIVNDGAQLYVEAMGNGSTTGAYTLTAENLGTGDLTITAGRPTGETGAVMVGATFDFEFTVTNDGAGGATASTEVRYFYNTTGNALDPDSDTRADGADGMPVAPQEIAILLDDATATATDTLLIPSTTTAATLHFGACVVAADGDADDTNNCSDPVAVTITRAPVTFPTTIDTQAYVVGTALSVTLPQAVGGAGGGFTYAINPTPALPDGLTFAAATRVLDGNPTAVQDITNYTYTATDAGGDVARLPFFIVILDSTTPAAFLTATNPDPLLENTLDGATLEVTLAFTTYVDPLTTSNFVLTHGQIFPGVLTLASVRRDSPTQATLTMAYDGHDLDQNAIINLRVLPSAHTGTGDIFINNTPVTAIVENNVATLSALALSGGVSLTPPFDSGTFMYTAVVINSVADIMVTPTATNDFATIAVDGTAVDNGTASAAIALTEGMTTDIAVLVTASDGVATQTYTIAVTRAAPPAPELSIAPPTTNPVAPTLSGDDSFDVVAVVTNNGGAATAEVTTVNFYLVADAASVTTVADLGSSDGSGTIAAGLAASGGTGTVTRNIFGPGTGSGFYGLYACFSTVTDATLATDCAFSRFLYDDNIGSTTTRHDRNTGIVVAARTETSRISHSNDSDWFSFVLENGARYQIDLTSANATLLTIRDSGGTVISASLITGGGNTLQSGTYTAAADGAHFIEVVDNGGGVGNYTLVITRLAAPPLATVTCTEGGPAVPATLTVGFGDQVTLQGYTPPPGAPLRWGTIPTGVGAFAGGQAGTTWTAPATDPGAFTLEYGAGGMSDTCTVAVTLSGPLSFAAAIAPQTYRLGIAVGTVTLPVVSAGAGAATYALTPALPAGLTFDGDATPPTITGTPEAIAAEADYAYTATTAGGALDLPFTLEVTLQPITITGGGGGPSDLAATVVEDSEAFGDATGTLTITNPNPGGSDEFVAITASDPEGMGTYGDFTIAADTGVWTYTLDNADDDTNALDALVIVPDVFTVVAAADSTVTKDITISVTGANDAPTATITAPAEGTQVNFDAMVTLTATGSDPDTADTGDTLSYQWSAAPDTGSFGNAAAASTTWTAPASGTDPVILTLTVMDDATTPLSGTATVTVNPVAVTVTFGAGGTTGGVTEDDPAANTATGTLDVTSSDGNNDVVAQTDTPGMYGMFTIDTAGAWTYTLDNTNAAINPLAAGDTLDDPFTVAAEANTAATVVITITITGANDAPTVAISAPTEGMQVNFNSAVTLTATGADPDTGTTLTYQWSANPATGSFANATAEDTTWTVPASGTTPVTLTLTVRDDATPSLTGTAQVMVNPRAAPPVDVTCAEGGPAVPATLSVGFGDQVTLQGFTPPFGAPLLWRTQPPGIGAFAGPRSLTIWTAPTHDPGAFNVVYSTGGTSATCTVAVTLSGPLSFAAAFAPQTYQLGIDVGTVTLPVVSAGAGAATYALTPALPAGLTFDAGATPPTITGTPEAIAAEADYAYTATTAGGALDLPFTLEVTLQTITINAATAADTAAAVTEDAATDTVTGTLTITNPNPAPNDSVEFVAITASEGMDSLGTFTITAAGAWTYTLDNADDDTNSLAASEGVSSTFTVVAAADNTVTQNIIISITGANDAPTARITAPAMGAEVSYNGVLTLTGSTSSDPDISDTPDTLTFAWDDGSETTGTFGDTSAADTTWTAPSTGTLGGITLRLTVTDSSGATSNTTVIIQLVALTITFADDLTGAVTEDGDLTDTGALTVTSSDPTGSTDVTPLTDEDGDYGLFSIAAGGAWTYTLGGNPANETAVNALPGPGAGGFTDNVASGAEVTDTFTVTAAAGGTPQDVVITITGANDPPTAIISAPADGMQVDFGATVTLTGGATTDPDTDLAGDLVYVWSASPPGRGSFTDNSGRDGIWIAPATVGAVTLRLTVDEVFFFGTRDIAEVTVNPVAVSVAFTGSVITGAVTEDNATTTATGALTVVTASDNKNVVVQTDQPGTYGSFSITAPGAWTYTLDNNNAATNALPGGQVVTDTFTVTASVNPAATVDITITITGANDAPEVTISAPTPPMTGTFSVVSGRQVTLRATATDPDIGATMAYAWTTSPANQGTFASETSANTTWDTPTVTEDTPVTLTLTVSDNAPSNPATGTATFDLTVTEGPSVAGNGINHDNDPATTADNPLTVTPAAFDAATGVTTGGIACGMLMVSNIPTDQSTGNPSTVVHRITDQPPRGIVTLVDACALTSNVGDNWNYQLDNSRPAAQDLGPSDSATDSFGIETTVGDITINSVISVSLPSNTFPDDSPIIVFAGGPSMTVDEGEMVTLDASGTRDPEEVSALTFVWEHTATDDTPPDMPIEDTDAVDNTFTFMAPDERTTLEFRLTVTEGSPPNQQSSTATFTVRVGRGSERALQKTLAAFGRAFATGTVSIFEDYLSTPARTNTSHFTVGGHKFDMATNAPSAGVGTGRDLSTQTPPSFPNTPSVSFPNTPTLSFPNDRKTGSDSDHVFHRIGNPVEHASAQPANLADTINSANLASTTSNGANAGTTGTANTPAATTTTLMSGQDLLMKSAFHLSLNDPTGTATPTGWSFWGRATTGNFNGDTETEAANADISVDGSVTSGYLGLDYLTPAGTRLGLAISQSDGEVDYDEVTDGNTTAGDLEAEMTSILPYIQWQPGESTNAWLLLGYGKGDAELSVDGDDEATDVDIDMQMLAFGLRGDLDRAFSRTELSWKASAFAITIESDDQPDLGGVDADSQRLRFAVEGRRPGALSATGGVFTPGWELGMRWEDGDVERGAAADAGLRFDYANPAAGWSMRGTTTFVLFSPEDYDEWTAGLQARFDPGTQGRGITFTLEPGWTRNGRTQQMGLDFTNALGKWSNRGLRLELTGERTERDDNDTGHNIRLTGSLRF